MIAEQGQVHWFVRGVRQRCHHAEQVRNLLSAGHKVLVWNRSKAKASFLEEAGAIVSDSPRAVAEASDLIFGLMASEETALDLARQVSQGMRPGAEASCLWICQ